MTRGEWWAQANLRAGFHYENNVNDFSGNGLHASLCETYPITYSHTFLGHAARAEGNGHVHHSGSLDTPLKIGSFTCIAWVRTLDNWHTIVPVMTRGFCALIVEVPPPWYEKTYYYGILLGMDHVGEDYDPVVIICREDGGETDHTLGGYIPSSDSEGFYGVTYNKSTGTAYLYWNGMLITSGSIGTNDVAYSEDSDAGYTSHTYFISPSYHNCQCEIDETVIFSEVKDAAWHRRAYEWLFGIYQEGGII